MKDVFDPATVAELATRIERLTPATKPQWGKMSVDQMLAHVNVAYDMVYDASTVKATGLKRLLMKWFVKGGVVGPKPYPRNSPTAPQFRMTGSKDFNAEKSRLLAYLSRVQAEGARGFEGRESASFGPLSSAEWNVLFYKHLDHHLTQFGV